MKSIFILLAIFLLTRGEYKQTLADYSFDYSDSKLFLTPRGIPWSVMALHWRINSSQGHNEAHSKCSRSNWIYVPQSSKLLSYNHSLTNLLDLSLTQPSRWSKLKETVDSLFGIWEGHLSLRMLLLEVSMDSILITTALVSSSLSIKDHGLLWESTTKVSMMWSSMRTCSQYRTVVSSKVKYLELREESD